MAETIGTGVAKCSAIDAMGNSQVSTNCLICGAEIPLYGERTERKVCNDCKRAVLAMREMHRAEEIRKLVGEIEDLAYWVHDYAGVIEDAEEREKMAEASEYLHILKALIKLCPDEVLNKLQL